MSRIDLFENYSDKVFKLGYFLSHLQDQRKKPDIDIQNVFMAYYLGSTLRLKATCEIEEETVNGVLNERVGPMSDDAIGYGLNHLKVESIQKGWYMLAKRAKRNGMLRDSPFHEYVVGVFDAIETYSSYTRTCGRCLERKVETKKGGKIQYYHRAVVLSLVGYDFPIPIGIEMMKRGEDEVSCALRLLKRIVSNLGARFLDIIMCDAMYCRPSFFSGCEKLGISAGAVLKENQQNLLESARSQKKVTEPILEKDNDEEKLKLWDMGEVFWETAGRDVRVIWADRKVWEKDEKSKDGAFHWAEKKRLFAFSKKLAHLPSDVIYSIGVHRWDIDAKLFMDMVKHWHLKHKTLHFENAYENMLSIRLMAYFVFMFFFFRHINSRRKKKIKSYIQMARMLYRSACIYRKPQIILRK